MGAVSYERGTPVGLQTPTIDGHWNLGRTACPVASIKASTEERGHHAELPASIAQHHCSAVTDGSCQVGGRAGRSKSAGGLACGHPLCRSTSLIRKRRPVGPYSSPMPRAVWWS